MYRWLFTNDPGALSEIATRVAQTGRAGDLITYTDLVAGIDFHIASVNGGQPFRLGIPGWTDLHRAIIGDFLGRLCAETYAAGRVMASAIVVASESRQPGPGYRDFMRRIGILRGRSDAEFLAHWTEETRRVHQWYAA